MKSRWSNFNFTTAEIRPAHYGMVNNQDSSPSCSSGSNRTITLDLRCASSQQHYRGFPLAQAYGRVSSNIIKYWYLLNISTFGPSSNPEGFFLKTLIISTMCLSDLRWFPPSNRCIYCRIPQCLKDFTSGSKCPYKHLFLVCMLCNEENTQG